jgi:hypothetical protein
MEVPNTSIDTYTYIMLVRNNEQSTFGTYCTTHVGRAERPHNLAHCTGAKESFSPAMS